MFKIRVRDAVQHDGSSAVDGVPRATEVDVEWDWKAYIPIWAAFAASIGGLFVASYNASSSIGLEQERLSTQMLLRAADKSSEQEMLCYLHRIDKFGLAVLPSDVKQTLTSSGSCL